MMPKSAEFEEFKRSPGYEDCRQLGRELAAANSGGVKAAIGMISNDLASWIALKAMEGNAVAIGEVIRAQIEHYLETKADAFVSESWTHWQKQPEQ